MEKPGRLDIRTAIAILALVVSAVSVFYAWRLSTQAKMIELKNTVNSIDGRLKALATKVDELKVGLPEGGVIAFDLNTGCPPGWSNFSKAQSRFVIGAAFKDTGRGGLTKYEYNENEGTEYIELTAVELPSHTHQFSDIYYAEHEAFTKGARKGRNGEKLADIRKDVDITSVPGGIGAHGTDGDNRGWAKNGTTGHAGEGQRFRHMPPYIALFYCINR